MDSGFVVYTACGLALAVVWGLFLTLVAVLDRRRERSER